MAANKSDGSSSYWKQVDLILPNGSKVLLTVDLPTYTKVCNRDTETLQELVKNYNEMMQKEDHQDSERFEPAADTSQTEMEELRPTRHEWTVVEVRKLLGLVKDNVDKLNAARSKGPIWRKISEMMQISSEKCQDKYKYLRKAYRNYVQQNNKTGSSPAKFDYAAEMSDIMGDDPSVTPTYTASSDRPQDDDTTIDESASKELEETPTAAVPAPKKSKKRSVDMMIEYLQERDESLKKILKDMHHESLEAMNRLIDKF